MDLQPRGKFLASYRPIHGKIRLFLQLIVRYALLMLGHIPRVDRCTLLVRSTITRSRSVSYFWFSSSMNSNEPVRLKLSNNRVTCSLSGWGLSTNDLPISAACIAVSSSLSSILRPSRGYSIYVKYALISHIYGLWLNRTYTNRVPIVEVCLDFRFACSSYN